MVDGADTGIGELAADNAQVPFAPYPTAVPAGYEDAYEYPGGSGPCCQAVATPTPIPEPTPTLGPRQCWLASWTNCHGDKGHSYLSASSVGTASRDDGSCPISFVTDGVDTGIGETEINYAPVPYAPVPSAVPAGYEAEGGWPGGSGPCCQQPEPTPTPEPTATPNPAPTATPIINPAPTATPEPDPTNTPEPTATPSDTPEPTPTGTPAPSISLSLDRASIVAGGWSEELGGYKYLVKETGAIAERDQKPDPHIATLTATVKDEAGQPMEGQTVEIKIPAASSGVC